MIKAAEPDGTVMNTVVRRLVATLAVWLLWGAAAGAAPFGIATGPGGEVRLATPEGAVLWRLTRPGAGTPHVEPTASGGFLIDGTILVDRRGLVLEERLGAPGGSDARVAPAGAAAAWDMPVLVSPDDETFSNQEPVFDSAGNAWIILRARDTKTLAVTTSLGHTNSWTAPVTLATTAGLFLDGAVTIDGDDRITVVYRRLEPDGVNANFIDVLRYVPGAGWSGPETIHATLDFFQMVHAAADSAGNLVVGFEGDGVSAMFTLIYDSAAGIWGPATRLSPAGPSAFVPTLVSNADGTAVYALFWVLSGAERGVYFSRFDTAGLAWNPPARLPRSAAAQIPGGFSVGAVLPAAVDGEGNLTVLSYRRRVIGGGTLLWVAQGSRVAPDGTAGAPVPLLVQLEDPPDILNFPDTEANETGDVFFVFRNRGPDQVVNLVALHYDSQTAAWEPRRILYRDQAGFHRVRIAFRTGDAAVLSFFDSNALPEDQLSTRLFDGTTWDLDKLPIPGSPASVFHETASDGGEVIMWCGNETASGSISTTWLRELAP